MIRVSISGRIHDEARVVSARFYLTPAGGIGLLRDRIATQLNITNKWAEENDAFIGHAKAFVQWGENEAIMLSTTGGGTEVKGSDIPAKAPNMADIGITAIVFGIELEAVQDRLKGIAAVIAGQYEEYCIYEHVHDHDHEHEHNHEHNHEHDHDHEHEHCDCNDHEHG